eukprot:jgi/Chlat1/6757/Chrsp50S06449
MGKLTALLLCTLAILYTAAHTSAQANAGAALLLFKSFIVSDPTGALSSWTSSNPCDGSWAHVTCANSQITQLNLNNLALRGIIRPEIGQLSSLQILDLSQNSFYSGVPSSLAQLTSLTTLNLSQNRLTGYLHDAIWSLPRLQLLDLSNNKLSGTLPTTTLGSALTQLRLNNNDFRGAISAGIPAATSLSELLLQQNTLTGLVPEGLSQLTQLNSVDLSNNYFLGPLPRSVQEVPKLASAFAGNEGLCGDVYVSSVTTTGTSLGSACSCQGLFRDSSRSGRCFTYISFFNQGAASAACAAAGGTLASIRNELENQQVWLIGKTNSANLWFGYNYDEVNNAFFWQDGTPIDYFAWNVANGEPYLRNQHCAAMIVTDRAEASWRDLYCEFPASPSYLCEFLPSSNGCPKGSVPIAGNITRGCYQYGKLTANTIDDGRLLCDGYQAKLATVNSQAADEAANETSTVTMSWIGLNDRDKPGTYVWEADPDLPVAYTNWAATEPSGGASNCVALRGDSPLNITDAYGNLVTTVQAGQFIDWNCQQSDQRGIGATLCQLDIENDYQTQFRGCCFSNSSFSSDLGTTQATTTHDNVADLTLDSCNQLCQGSSQFAVQNGNQCICGAFQCSKASPDDLCSANCAGDATQKCGGPTAAAIYAVVGPSSPSTPSPPGSNGGGGSSVGAIIGAIAGVAVVLIAAVLLFVWWRKRKQNAGGKDADYYEAKAPLSPTAPVGGHDFEAGIVNDGSTMIFKYSDLHAATGRFSADNILGWGGFGGVYIANFANGTRLAVKRLELGGQQGEIEFLAEVEALMRVQHPNLVRMHGYCTEHENVLLVLELLAGGNLANRLHRAVQPLDWTQRLRIAVGMARGLQYLHDVAHIVHRDFKPANILLDESLVPKISDFGLAKCLNEHRVSHTTRVVGTAGYTSPEYAELGRVDYSCDVYAYGIVLLELVTGRTPLDMSRPSGEQWTMLWVQRKYDANQVETVLDATLPMLNLEQARSIIEVALRCASRTKEQRPLMRDVLSTIEPLLPKDDPLNQKVEVIVSTSSSSWKQS